HRARQRGHAPCLAVRPRRALRRPASQREVVARLAELDDVLLRRGGRLLHQLRDRARLAARREDVHLRPRDAGGNGCEDQPGLRGVATGRPTMTTDGAGGGIMTPTDMDQMTTPAE